MSTVHPPETARGSVEEVLHGHRIADPYRWLEDPDAADTRAWVAAQNEVTEAALAALPERAWFSERLQRLVSRPKAGVPRYRNGVWFTSRNDGSTAQDIWYLADSAEAFTDEQAFDERARVLVDPTELRADGTASIGPITVAPGGERIAWAVSFGGSDWMEYRISAADGSPIAEESPIGKFSAAVWLPDGDSFLYLSFPDGGRGESAGTETADLGRANLMRHRVGSPVSDDEFVMSSDDPETHPYVQVSDDDQWLIVTLHKGTLSENRVWLCPLGADESGATTIGEALPLIDVADAEYDPVLLDDGQLWVATDHEAPQGRVLRIDIATGERHEVIAETSHALQGALHAGGDLLVLRLVDAQPALDLHARDGRHLGAIDLPAGALAEISASPELREVLLGLSTPVEPLQRLRVNLDTLAVRDLPSPGMEPAPGIETSRHRATSADGTRVPYVLVRPAGAQDGPRPTLLWGYGGFKISIQPDYRPGWVAWLEAGGNVVFANLRGGGEFGTEWYEQGRQRNKQNVFDDFIAVAEDLVATGVTTSAQLVLHGRSNGGLLVGAVMTQRPDLAAVALPSVGVLDIARFHLFTVGRAWKSDYGDPELAEDFESLLRWSPLHNVRDGVAYPATLITTGDHDDRVVPLHSHKFAAALQHASAGPAPVLTRIDTSAGHGAGRPRDKIAQEWADQLAFAAHHTGLRPGA